MERHNPARRPILHHGDKLCDCADYDWVMVRRIMADPDTSNALQDHDQPWPCDYAEAARRWHRLGRTNSYIAERVGSNAHTITKLLAQGRREAA